MEEANMGLRENSSWKTRRVKGGFPDRSFSIEFWQEQGDWAIFATAWKWSNLLRKLTMAGNPHDKRTVKTFKPS